MKTDILIIGAGFAGAATAFHLSKSFRGKILLVEREELPGYHASGRNASLVLQSVESSEIRQIVAKSQAAYTRRQNEVGYNPLGSLLLGSRKQLERVEDPGLIEATYYHPEEVRRRIPILSGHEFEAALETHMDGVMDISQLLQFYLDGARENGCELKLNCPVTSIQRRGGHFILETAGGRVEAAVLINAAGAWAPAIAEMAGIESLPMRSYKRHLFVLEGIEGIDTGWPFVWSLEKNFYFRPESGGLLFSVCDEEACDQDFVPTVNPEILERLAELISEELPALEHALQRRVWSCFRTKTPVGGFHLGWSRELEGFFWIAGLGGHGMGASWEVGRIAAREIENGPGKEGVTFDDSADMVPAGSDRPRREL